MGEKKKSMVIQTRKTTVLKWIRKWRIESYNRPGIVYVVAKTEDGEWGCSCPHWKFRRIECKHIRQVKRDRERTQQIKVLDPENIQENRIIRIKLGQRKMYGEAKSLRIKKNKYENKDRLRGRCPDEITRNLHAGCET